MVIPLFFLFENVVTKDFWQSSIEPELGHACVLIDAASLGWHHRRRTWVANFSLPLKVAKK
eukprot:6159626-Heterocapsa_arctica.AAC.1